MAKAWPTETKESFRTAWFRRLMNIFPAFWGTGGRILFIASDWKEIQVRLPLSFRTRNYVGTIFGGSLYGAADPFLMIQLLEILGKEYVVWDKSASIRFRKPGDRALNARFLISEALLTQIKAAVAEKGEWVFNQVIEWVDKEGQVYAYVSKELYVADKTFYKHKKSKQISGTE